MPIIFNVIENAKLKALENSTYGVIDAVRMNYMENLMNSENGTVTLTGSVTTLTLSGEHPIAGNWEIKNSAEVTENRGIAVTGVKFASMNEYTCTNVKNNVIQNKVECTKDESSVQPVTKVTFTLNGTSYEVEENTSWTTFLQTNTDYEVSGENVVLKGTTRKVLLNGTAIDKDSTITAGTYTLEEEVERVLTYTDTDNSGTKNIGDKVCIKSECFYIISNDGTNIRMLAEYNLNVGSNKYTGAAEGLQNENVKGWVSGGTTYGSVAFSTTSTAYDNNSIKTYVDAYQTTLNTLAEDSDLISGATLLTKEELTGTTDAVNNPNNINLGCSADGNTCANSSYSWVYGTSYWSRSASSSNYVWNVGSDVVFGSSGCGYGGFFGVRPVVTISTSSI